MLTWVSMTFCNLMPNWKYSAQKIVSQHISLVQSKLEINYKRLIDQLETSLSRLQSCITLVMYLDSRAGLHASMSMSPPSMASTRYIASGNASCNRESKPPCSVQIMEHHLNHTIYKSHTTLYNWSTVISSYKPHAKQKREVTSMHNCTGTTRSYQVVTCKCNKSRSSNQTHKNQTTFTPKSPNQKKR